MLNSKLIHFNDFIQVRIILYKIHTNLPWLPYAPNPIASAPEMPAIVKNIFDL